MKMKVVFLLLISAVSIVNPARAQVRLGVLGGPTVSDMSSKTLESLKDDFSTRTGFGIGGVLDFGLSRHFGLRFEPMYLQRNLKREMDYPEFGIIGSNLDLNYIELPALLRLSLSSRWIKPYIVGGASVSYLLNAKEEYTDDLGRELF